jgi:uncharacterized protein (DUF433 family)
VGTGAESWGDTGGDCAAAFQPATDQPVNTAAARRLTREFTLQGGTRIGDRKVTADLRAWYVSGRYGSKGPRDVLFVTPVSGAKQAKDYQRRRTGFAAINLKSMATVTEIGSLISLRPEIRGGRPCITGTGVSVRRIAQWHNMGLIPEEIVRKFGHLSLAQVHAALAYYHANLSEIDAGLESEARETETLEEQNRR